MAFQEIELIRYFSVLSPEVIYEVSESGSRFSVCKIWPSNSHFGFFFWVAHWINCCPGFWVSWAPRTDPIKRLPLFGSYRDNMNFKGLTLLLLFFKCSPPSHQNNNLEMKYFEKDEGALAQSLSDVSGWPSYYRQLSTPREKEGNWGGWALSGRKYSVYLPNRNSHHIPLRRGLCFISENTESWGVGRELPHSQTVKGGAEWEGWAAVKLRCVCWSSKPLFFLLCYAAFWKGVRVRIQLL